MKKLIVLLGLMVSTLSTMAIPAKPGQWRLLTLADGTQVEAELRGDEFCHFWTTTTGACYVESSIDDVFELTDKATIAQKAFLRRQMHDGPNHTRADVGMQREPIIGKKKGLVIMVEFKNKTFGENHTWTLFNDILNKVGFSSDEGFKGSVKDYFLSQSKGLFELDFDLVGPLTMPNTYGYYGANTKNDDTNPGQMIATACEMADEYVDFKDYDWDGDGEVDQVFVIYAGLGEAAGGDKNTIWPHEWKLEYSDYGKVLTLDGVNINTYACGPELTNRGSARNPKIGLEGIGTICHEFTHCLGIPDMYDTSYVNYGMSYWDLMASGSYNGSSFSPACFTSFERMFCGWQQPIVLNKDTTVSNMKALSDDGDAFIIYNDSEPNEFYMLENRQLTGWDAGLPGNGLLVIHVYYDELVWKYNFVNNTTIYPEYNKFQRCTIIPADNSFGKDDVKTDVYPYKDKDSLTNTSLPRAELYALNADGIHYTSKPVTKIRQENGIVSFVFLNRLKNKSAGVQTIEYTAGDDRQPLYDLSGRRVNGDARPLRKGIYISNGRKVTY